ncbi:uncharacterized protein CANTADRAFT_47146 [Suhomyces tanzawaensis NRRL Y-17324]|uniref:CNH-domain-containing protein n=1 Tax=Suhomyces tanzawaensis NRRL Y-17324 TaxID=984487 RepID=A0A1E4SND8_9ASCO|nr:uncharacterized protein CANTADRAFT_47146 [Suhomyces tanzawaensis NRRL Y-17324]ODV80902.1 hypothetical protein CANTADRAFT_47146 [Suhomyces tanzawaensis NRRL Y-17324]
MPNIPPRPHPVAVQNLTIDTGETFREQYTYDEEETILSYEPPKPMGPKELPDYEAPSVPPRPSKVRQYQQLSRSQSQPIELPYPTHSPEPELTPDDLIHPESPAPDVRLQYRSTQTSNHSLSTPNRIPKLNNNGPLFRPTLNQKTLLPVISSSILESDLPYLPISPLDTPDRLNRTHTVGGADGPRSTSPVRSHTLNIPGSGTSPTNNYADTVLAERQYKPKSPSPNKYGRSPSIYGYHTFPYQDHNETDELYEYDETSFVNEYQYDYENEQKHSKWNTVDTSRRMSNGDYNFLDNDYLETPTAHYFDYSILPDLPSSMPSALESPSSSKKDLMYSPFSANGRDSVYTSQTSPTVMPALPSKKKDDALPPVPLDLPQLPFTSASLVSQHFATCKSIWSLSSIFDWCLKLKIWLHDLFIPRREFKKALIKLLVFHRRELPLDLIGQNVDQILESLLRGNAISYHHFPAGENDTPELKESQDPGVIMNESADISGVLTELTPCYYNGNDHGNKGISLRCYSSQCYLNKMIDHEAQLKNMNINEIILGDDWASHWKLSAIDLKNIDKNISKRQSLVFDLIRYEQTFIQRASCFVESVGPEFIKTARLFMGNDIVLLNKFEEDIIKPGKELVKIHQNILFEPLLRILISGGKFINNVGEIANLYNAWSIEVKNQLLTYMSTVPMIEDLLNNEHLKRWVDVNVRNMPRVKELKVNGPLLFMSTFNSRYQSLPLQLFDVRKLYDAQEPEYISLTKAIDGIKRLGNKVNEMKRHADNIYALKKVHKQLVWKNSVNQPQTNLGSENRKFFFRGDVTRKGDLKINSSTNHLILLDHFLFITERVKNPRSSSYPLNRVIDNPVPVELLLVEEKDVGSEINPLSKALTLSSQPTVPLSTTETVEEDEPSSFPFKIRYAGRGKHDAYTFSTKTERERAEWITHFTEARSNICRRLGKTEPYTVDSISNTCFAYEMSNRIQKLPICAPFDPIYEVSTNALNKLTELGYSNDLYNFTNSRDHLVYSKVLSVSLFEFRRTKFHLVGLASGLYCSDTKNRWKKVVHGTDITKISVDSSINLVVILGSKHLRYYPLDLIVGVYYEKRREITGVSLSNDPVSFFSIGTHRKLTMLFYAKKKTNSGSTNFKVLIPETDNDGIFSAFKVAKRFYIQAECYGISIFNTSFAVHTNKGYEILELDKLLPRSIPEIPQSDSSKRIDGYSRKSISSVTGVEAIRKYVSTNVRPMGMYKLANNTEFLCVYNNCAIFTNKHGKLSRTSFIRFDFKAKSISFIDNNLFIVCEEVIEVWSISDFVNGSNKLIQVITGKDITAIDPETLCFAMANPLVQGLQLVFRLVANASSSPTGASPISTTYV